MATGRSVRTRLPSRARARPGSCCVRHAQPARGGLMWAQAGAAWHAPASVAPAQASTRRCGWSTATLICTSHLASSVNEVRSGRLLHPNSEPLLGSSQTRSGRRSGRSGYASHALTAGDARQSPHDAAARTSASPRDAKLPEAALPASGGGAARGRAGVTNEQSYCV